MTTIGRTKYNEWQGEVQRMKTSDNKWYNKWQRVVQQVTTSDNEWRRVTKNEDELQWMTASDNTNE